MSDRRVWPHEIKMTQKVQQATACSARHSTGDIFIACLTKQESFLKIRSAVSSPGNVSVTVPVVTRTEFALVPREEGNVTDTAIRNWEGTFHSVTEFFEARSEHQSMPMPAVSVVHSYCYCLYE